MTDVYGQCLSAGDFQPYGRKKISEWILTFGTRYADLIDSIPYIHAREYVTPHDVLAIICSTQHLLKTANPGLCCLLIHEILRLIKEQPNCFMRVDEKELRHLTEMRGDFDISMSPVRVFLFSRGLNFLITAWSQGRLIAVTTDGYQIVAAEGRGPQNQLLGRLEYISLLEKGFRLNHLANNPANYRTDETCLIPMLTRGQSC